jgi:uncharacterized protein YndB with AHSA1/START domain
MKHYDSIEVAAQPEAVWPLLADPQQMANWHAKLVAVRRSASGTVRLGDRFGTTYTLSGSENDAEAEVIRCQPPAALTYRHHVNLKQCTGYVDESFDLQYNGKVTRVKQTLDFSKSGLPLWARGLMWFVSRFGKPVGPSLFEPLKRAAEANSSPLGQDSNRGDEYRR